MLPIIATLAAMAANWVQQFLACKAKEGPGEPTCIVIGLEMAQREMWKVSKSRISSGFVAARIGDLSETLSETSWRDTKMNGR